MSPKVAVLFLSVCLSAISLYAAEPIDAAKISPSIAQVVKMHESGVAPDVLLAYVRETPVSKPNAEEVLYLTEKGIPKDVIVTLLSKRVWTETPAPQSHEPAPAQPQAQTQTALPPAVATTQPTTQSVVYVQQPAPVTYVGAPYYPYYPYYSSYYPYYYPSVAVGIGFGYGYGWGHGWGGHGHWHGGGNHGGGIHVHRR